MITDNRGPRVCVCGCHVQGREGTEQVGENEEGLETVEGSLM